MELLTVLLLLLQVQLDKMLLFLVGDWLGKQDLFCAYFHLVPLIGGKVSPMCKTLQDLLWNRYSKIPFHYNCFLHRNCNCAILDSLHRTNEGRRRN